MLKLSLFLNSFVYINAKVTNVPGDFFFRRRIFYDFGELAHRTMSAVSLCSGHIFAGARTITLGVKVKSNRTALVLIVLVLIRTLYATRTDIARYSYYIFNILRLPYDLSGDAPHDVSAGLRPVKIERCIFVLTPR